MDPQKLGIVIGNSMHEAAWNRLEIAFPQGGNWEDFKGVVRSVNVAEACKKYAIPLEKALVVAGLILSQKDYPIKAPATVKAWFIQSLADVNQKFSAFRQVSRKDLLKKTIDGWERGIPALKKRGLAPQLVMFNDIVSLARKIESNINLMSRVMGEFECDPNKLDEKSLAIASCQLLKARKTATLIHRAFSVLLACFSCDLSLVMKSFDEDLAKEDAIVFEYRKAFVAKFKEQFFQLVDLFVAIESTQERMRLFALLRALWKDAKSSGIAWNETTFDTAFKALFPNHPPFEESFRTIYRSMVQEGLELQEPYLRRYSELHAELLAWVPFSAALFDSNKIDEEWKSNLYAFNGIFDYFGDCLQNNTLPSNFKDYVVILLDHIIHFDVDEMPHWATDKLIKRPLYEDDFVRFCKNLSSCLEQFMKSAETLAGGELLLPRLLKERAQADLEAEIALQELLAELEPPPKPKKVTKKESAPKAQELKLPQVKQLPQGKLYALDKEVQLYSLKTALRLLQSGESPRLLVPAVIEAIHNVMENSLSPHVKHPSHHLNRMQRELKKKLTLISLGTIEARYPYSAPNSTSRNIIQKVDQQAAVALRELWKTFSEMAQEVSDYETIALPKMPQFKEESEEQREGSVHLKNFAYHKARFNALLELIPRIEQREYLGWIVRELIRSQQYMLENAGRELALRQGFLIDGHYLEEYLNAYNGKILGNVLAPHRSYILEMVDAHKGTDYLWRWQSYGFDNPGIALLSKAYVASTAREVPADDLKEIRNKIKDLSIKGMQISTALDRVLLSSGASCHQGCR